MLALEVRRAYSDESAEVAGAAFKEDYAVAVAVDKADGKDQAGTDNGTGCTPGIAGFECAGVMRIEDDLADIKIGIRVLKLFHYCRVIRRYIVLKDL